MKPETPNNKNQEELITEQGKLIEELQKDVKRRKSEPQALSRTGRCCSIKIKR